MHQSILKNPLTGSELGSLLISLLLAVVFLYGCDKAVGQDEPREVEPAVAELGAGFRAELIDVNGTRLHVVRGGSGPNLLLLHGFPENWSAYSELMPQLAEQYSVTAVDLRGIGRSTATPEGYDAQTQGEDIAQLTAALDLGDVHVVGHDLGGMVGYAFARRDPERVRTLLLLESPLAGIEPWEQLKADPRNWHFGFHQTPNLPDKLLAGREYTYIREGYLTSDRVSDAKVQRYARAYAAPDHLRAGLAFYRAFPESETYLAEQRDALDIPILIAGADQVFGPIGEEIAEGLRSRGCSQVSTETISDSGHYVLDDQPEQIAKLITQHAR